MVIISSILSLASSYILGRCVLNISVLKHASNGVFQLAVGTAVLGYILLGLAAVGVLNLKFVVTLLSTLSVVSLLTFFKQNKFKSNFFAYQSFLSRLDKYEVTLFGIMTAILIISFFEVLAPSTTEDTISYHFRIPYDYVTQGKIYYSPSLLFNMPHLTEVLVTIPFLFSISDIGAQIYYFYWTVLFSISMVTFGTTFFNLKTGLLGAVLIMLTPMFTYIKTAGMVEIALSTFIILALVALKKSSLEKGNKLAWIFICGCCVGISCGIKYYGLLSLIAVLTLVMILSIKEFPKNRFLLITVFLIGVIIFGFPFYLKNFLMVGDPLYPKLYQFIGGRDWSTALGIAQSDYVQLDKKAGGATLYGLVTTVWSLTVDGHSYLSGKTGYGFLYLIAAPLFIFQFLELLFRENHEKKPLLISSITLLWIFVLVSYVLWYYFSLHRGRHLFVVYSVLSVLIADLLLNQSKFFLKNNISILNLKVFKWLTILTVALHLSISLYFNMKFLNVAIGVETTTSYLNRVRPNALAYQEIERNIPVNAKVLHLFGTSQYYLRREQFYPSPFFQGWIDWTNIDSVLDYYRLLKEGGFTHVVGPSADVLRERAVVKSASEYAAIKTYNKYNSKLIEGFTDEIVMIDVAIPKSRSLNLGNDNVEIYLYKLKY